MPHAKPHNKNNIHDIFKKLHPTPMLLRTLEPRIALDAAAIITAGEIIDTQPEINNTQENPVHITQEISETNQQTQAQTVSVSITLNNDTQPITSNNPITFNPLDNDQNIRSGTTVIIETQPTQGTVVVNANNTITYTPTNATLQQDTFTYGIIPPPDPIAVNDKFTVIKDTPFTFDVALNDQNANGAEFIVTTNPQFGTISKPPGEPATSSQFIYTPNAGFVGVDHIDYIIRIDGIETTATALFRVQDTDLQTHYIPPRTDATVSTTLRITTLSNNNVNFTITYLSTGETETGTVNLYSPFQIENNLSLGRGISATFQQIQRDGILIEADGPINVHSYADSPNLKDSFISEGMKDAGTQFFIGSIPGAIASAPGGDVALSITATEDNTQITITPPPQKQNFQWQDNPQGQNTNVITITLNKGDSYMLRSAQESTQQIPRGPVPQFFSLLGVEINADKPIITSAGNLRYAVIGSNTGDEAWETISPVSRVDTQYIVRSGISPAERIAIVATQDDTDVFTSGIKRTTLNKGEVYTEELPLNNVTITAVSGTKPIYLYQFSGDSDFAESNGVSRPLADNGFAQIHPIENTQSGNLYLDIPPTEITDTLTSIFIEKDKTNTLKVFRVDGTSEKLTNVNLNSFNITTNIIENADYVVYEAELTNGQYVISADANFWVTTRNTVSVGTAFTGSFVSHYTDRIGNENGGLLAINDHAKTMKNQPVTINATDNDASVYDSAPDITNVQNPTNGTAQINGQNIIYTPNQNFVGTDSFTYTLSDQMGNTQTATVSIQVNDEIQPATVTIDPRTPPIPPLIDNFTFSEDIAIIPLSAAFTPTENDPVTYAATGLPNGLDINPNTGLISGTPQSGTQGTYVVTVTATDNDGSSQISFNINVNELGNSHISEQKDIIPIDVGLMPVDADSATYTATGLPSGLTINPNNGQITGAPNQGTAGIYPVTITVTDKDGTRNAQFNIIVSQNEIQPIPEGIPAPTINAGFIPADSGTITYNAIGLPDGLSINPNTGLITGTPNQGTVGTYPITVSATDQDGTSQISLIIIVQANFSPFISDLIDGKTNDTAEPRANQNNNQTSSFKADTHIIDNAIRYIQARGENTNITDGDTHSNDYLSIREVVRQSSETEKLFQNNQTQSQPLSQSLQAQIWREIDDRQEKINRFIRALQETQ